MHAIALDFMKKNDDLVIYVNSELISDVKDIKEPIQRLHLYASSFVTIDAIDIGDLSGLEELSMERVKMLNYDLLSKAFNLKFLSITKGELTSIPLVVNQLKRLEYLDLSGNRITSIKEIAWEQLPSLKDIKLGSNTIEEIPSDSIEGAVLERLSFANNPIVSFELSDNIESSKLEILDLSSTKISTLPSNFYQLSQLKRLDLSYTQVVQLPIVLLELPNLKVLHLEALNWTKETVTNQLTNRTYALQTLYLSFSSLEEIPDWVQYFAHILELNLNYTNIKALPSWLNDLPYLQYVYLEGTLLADVYENLPATEKAKLRYKLYY